MAAKPDPQPNDSPPNSIPNRSDSGRLINISIAIGVSVIGAGILIYTYFQPTDTSNEFRLTVKEAREKLDLARKSLRDEDFERAEKLANEVFYNSDLSDEAMLIAGETATKQGRFADAVTYYQLVSKENDDESITSNWATAEIFRETQAYRLAEFFYRETLKIDPDNTFAHRGLATVLGVTGRRWESRPHLLALVKGDNFQVDDLMFLGEIHRQINQEKRLSFAKEATDEYDPYVDVGLAHIALTSREFDKAESLALKANKRLLEFDEPACTEAFVVLGKSYLETGFPDGFDNWRQSLPKDAESHPEIWFIFGAHCESLGDTTGALRCFYEAMKLDPNHSTSCFRISRILLSRNEKELADAYLQRAKLLSEFGENLVAIGNTGDDLARMLTLSQLAVDMGRVWEACAWMTVVASNQPQDEQFQRQQLAMQSNLSADLPLLLPNFDLTQTHPLDAKNAMPAWESLAELETNRPSQATGQDSSNASISFLDVAKSMGVDFTYVNGDDPNQPGMQIYEEMGGAIVVLDFDQDNWPDIYLSQGGAAPLQSSPDGPTDRLFRNLGNNQFEDVTDSAQLGDRLYSQGASAGDINNDGFPDLIVCNVDSNRVLLNQGDGTFIDITENAGLSGRRWTTSGTIADLNMDGNPDLYFCNYASGSEPFTVRCDDNGVARACQPSQFAAEQDRVYFGNGDGTFQDVTDSSGFVAPNGRALGIVVGDLDGSGKLSIFVANDTTDNFFFQPVAGVENQFEELGLLRGLASDLDGIPQACMGIAADDVDGDGLLDLFVTNFYNESNTFYHQLTGGVFSDDTRLFGLREPSLSLLGFGTQFIDFNSDGKPDLFIANGHVDDYRHLGHGYEMRPQFFVNAGDGKMNEVKREELPSYFQEEYLGRSVAVLDWNRDGKQDLAVMHLDQPVSLLQNESEASGNFLQLHLTATQTSRDAFGSKVRLRCSDEVFSKQLIAGSGYQASNQRIIMAGVGKHSKIDELIVTWPSGAEEKFSNVAANQELHLIEGSGELVVVGN